MAKGSVSQVEAWEFSQVLQKDNDNRVNWSDEDMGHLRGFNRFQSTNAVEDSSHPSSICRSSRGAWRIAPVNIGVCGPATLSDSSPAVSKLVKMID